MVANFFETFKTKKLKEKKRADVSRELSFEENLNYNINKAQELLANKFGNETQRQEIQSEIKNVSELLSQLNAEPENKIIKASLEISASSIDSYVQEYETGQTTPLQLEEEKALEKLELARKSLDDARKANIYCQFLNNITPITKNIKKHKQQIHNIEQKIDQLLDVRNFLQQLSVIESKKEREKIKKARQETQQEVEMFILDTEKKYGSKILENWQLAQEATPYLEEDVPTKITPKTYLEYKQTIARAVAALQGKEIDRDASLMPDFYERKTALVQTYIQERKALKAVKEEAAALVQKILALSTGLPDELSFFKSSFNKLVNSLNLLSVKIINNQDTPPKQAATFDKLKNQLPFLTSSLAPFIEKYRQTISQPTAGFAEKSPYLLTNLELKQQSLEKKLQNKEILLEQYYDALIQEINETSLVLWPKEKEGSLSKKEFKKEMAAGINTAKKLRKEKEMTNKTAEKEIFEETFKPEPQIQFQKAAHRFIAQMKIAPEIYRLNKEELETMAIKYEQLKPFILETFPSQAMSYDYALGDLVAQKNFSGAQLALNNLKTLKTLLNTDLNNKVWQKIENIKEVGPSEFARVTKNYKILSLTVENNGDVILHCESETLLEEQPKQNFWKKLWKKISGKEDSPQKLIDFYFFKKGVPGLDLDLENEFLYQLKDPGAATAQTAQ